MFKKARKNYRIYASFLVLAIALVVALGVVGVVRANVGGSTEKSIDGLVACLANNPDHKVCAALVRVLDTLLPEEDVLGGVVTRAQAGETSVFPSLGLSDPDNESVVVGSACRTMNFPNTTTTPAVVTNRSPNDLLVDFADLHIITPPSATIVLTAGTSTVTSVVYNHLALNGTASNLDGLFNRLVFPTTTTSTINLFSNAHFSNLRLTTTTVDQLAAPNLASSTANQRCGSGSPLGCRVGASPDPVIVLKPNESLLLHIEATDPRWAVTTTLSTSTPSTDPQDIRRRTMGDVGLRGQLTACWKSVSTSTPQ